MRPQVRILPGAPYMDMRELIAKYLSGKYTMQLATAASNRPWCCTVYYVIDEQLNLYWASLPSRRHSLEIAKNPKVSAAIVVKNVIGELVIGVQAEGVAEVVENPSQIKPITKKYAQKFGFDEQWASDFSSLKTKHRLYKLSPSSFVLFDEENFADDPRKEFKP